MTRLLFLMLIVVAGCSGASPAPSPDDTLAAFRSAGLDASPLPLVADPTLPLGCRDARFTIRPANHTGRVFVCASQPDVDRVAGYPRAASKSSTFPNAWVFVKGNVIVRLDGSLPEATARRYEAAIP